MVLEKVLLNEIITFTMYVTVWKEVNVEKKGPKRAVIRWTPDAELQQRLSVGEGEGVSGQLVLRYDVDNQLPGGSILVRFCTLSLFCLF